MEFIYIFCGIYLLTCIYAFLTELPHRRGPWSFTILFSLAFPVLLLIYLLSQKREHEKAEHEKAEQMVSKKFTTWLIFALALIVGVFWIHTIIYL